MMILSSISGAPIGIPVSSRVTYSAALYSTGFRSQESFLFMTLSLKLCNVCVNVNSLHLQFNTFFLNNLAFVIQDIQVQVSLLLRYVTKVISPQSVNEPCAVIFPDYLCWGAQVSKHCAREAWGPSTHSRVQCVHSGLLLCVSTLAALAVGGRS